MKTMTMKSFLKLKGKTVVFIDWANVHGWQEKIKWKINLEKLYCHLKRYKEIKEFRFYFGTDIHPASKKQLKEAEKIGFKVITKPVKYLPIKDKKVVFWKRKCDFDLEIGLDCFERLNQYETFIFFSGDGDFATLYKRLIKRKKQIIVIYTSGTLGREVAAIQKGVYKFDIKRIKALLKK